jgi:hypothetical protein
MAEYGTPFVDLSGQVTAGGTAQTFAPADPSRRYLRICAPAANGESLWLNDKGKPAAVGGAASFELTPGSKWVWFPTPTTAVSVVSATTGTRFEGAAG